MCLSDNQGENPYVQKLQYAVPSGGEAVTGGGVCVGWLHTDAAVQVEEVMKQAGSAVNMDASLLGMNNQRTTVTPELLHTVRRRT